MSYYYYQPINNIGKKFKKKLEYKKILLVDFSSWAKTAYPEKGGNMIWYGEGEMFVDAFIISSSGRKL